MMNQDCTIVAFCNTLNDQEGWSSSVILRRRNGLSVWEVCLVRDISGIQLRSVILHILDRSAPGGIVKSSRAMNLAGDERVIRYFTKHITSSLKDPRAIAADFTPNEKAIILPNCSGIIDGRIDLVLGSHAVADHLYSFMAKDRRIVSGDLAVCVFSAASTPAVPAYVCIMKLDPGSALVHRTEYDDEGLAIISAEVSDNVLPTEKERLQKCAFVRIPSNAQEFPLLVLDDQIGSKPGENVAQYFLYGFLEAAPWINAETRTAALVRALNNGRRVVKKALTDDEVASLELISRAALRQQSVNLDELVQALPIPEEAKEKFDEVLRRDVPDRVFEIDRRVVTRSVPKRTFIGDGGLRVQIPIDLAPSILQQPTQKRDENGRSYWEVVLHTETWTELGGDGRPKS